MISNWTIYALFVLSPYSLEAGSFDSLKMLDIDPKTGAVVILEKLDYEVQKWLNFTVRAQDNGVPIRSNYVDVVVEILDENDNSPLFVQASLDPGKKNAYEIFFLPFYLKNFLSLVFLFR